MAFFFGIGVFGYYWGPIKWGAASVQPSHCNITATLSPRLSEAASITPPGDDMYDAFLVRASSPRVRPAFSAIVEPATQQDIQHVVCIERSTPVFSI